MLELQQQQPQQGSSSEEQPKLNHGGRKERRLVRACTARTSARLFPVSPAVERPAIRKPVKDEQCKIITPLTNPPSIPSQLPRWNLRSMWELGSVLNFLNIFRPLLNINAEFSVEELETALITPNNTLDDIHIPILKAIPPVTRMALGHATWVTVLCRKLKDWWHWVADGEIPIVASHGEEIETYKTLEPEIRVLILKALCDIRVEQEDIRNYIDNSIKHGVQLSAFRKERIGGDSQGTSYWYEDDPVIGHRLYREIRRVEYKKVKIRGPISLPTISCQWETVASNFDEFSEVSEKLFSSRNRTETALGKKLKFDLLPEIEKIHKRKERSLKKQHRQAVLLDSFLSADGLPTGRSLRDRKPVTYTFDDFDRSINEAIKITKRRQISPEPVVRREVSKPEVSSNGKWNGPSQGSEQVSNETLSPKSTDYEETDGEHISDPLDRSNRRRQRPQRYSAKEFVEAISDNEADFDSDDDIVGEAVYDEEYLRSRKQRKASSSSEGDDEYRWDPDENVEEEEEDSLSISDEEMEETPLRSKKFVGHSSSSRHSKRGMKLRSVDELQSGGGLRQSRRATRTQINYRQYELSESEADYSEKPDNKPNNNSSVDRQHSDASNSSDKYSMPSDDSEVEAEGCVEKDEEGKEEDNKPTSPVVEYGELLADNEVQKEPVERAANSPPAQEADGLRKRRFLDLNELAFDDGPINLMKDRDDTDNF